MREGNSENAGPISRLRMDRQRVAGKRMGQLALMVALPFVVAGCISVGSDGSLS